MAPLDLTDPTVLNDPAVRARLEYLAQCAETNIYQGFIAKHPELLNVDLQTDLQNKQIIDHVMTENGLTLTPENLERAFRVALEAGQLTLPMYSPAEEQAFPQMTTKQMEQYLKQKYQAPPKPNMWEMFPTAGERTPRHESSGMTEEDASALRSKLGMR